MAAVQTEPNRIASHPYTPAVACLADHSAAITLLGRRRTIEDEAGLAAILDELLAGATAIDVQQLIAEARAAGSLDDLLRSQGNVRHGDIRAGESEVGKPRDCTRSDRFDYRIVFITDALDADRRQLFLLPNPMDPANQDFFRFPGSGLTCAFRLEA